MFEKYPRLVIAFVCTSVGREEMYFLNVCWIQEEEERITAELASIGESLPEIEQAIQQKQSDQVKNCARTLARTHARSRACSAFWIPGKSFLDPTDPTHVSLRFSRTEHRGARCS